MPDIALHSLLPQNRTALESALADAIDVTAHDERTIATLYRPQGITSPLLPWLAWANDVLAWPRGANETTRRRLVAGSWRLHRLQGTLAGYREIADVFGWSIVGAITPPAKLFTSPALTRDERNAFVARYPQLRLYSHRTLGQHQGGMLYRAHLGGGLFPLISDAWLRILPRAYLWQDGVETELTAVVRTAASETREAETVTEVRKPGRADGLAFCAGTPRYLAKSDAADRIYNLRLTESYQDSRETVRRKTVQPGLSPIDVRFDEVAIPGTARGIFAGRPFVGGLWQSTARDRLFRRLYLFDPEIEVIRRSATLHLSAGRLGMPAHHAELILRVPGKISRQAAGRHCRGYLVATDKTPLADGLSAMREITRASDRITLDTALNRPATAGEHNPAGTLKAGAWIDN